MEISTTWIFLTAVFTALVFLYKHFTKHFGYWESQGIPTDKAYPIIGTEISLFTKPPNEIDLERSKKYGRIFGGYLLTNRILNIIDPEILKLILVKDFNIFVNRQTSRSGVKMLDTGLVFAINDDWKRIRSVTSPTFSSGKLRKMTFLLKDIAKNLAKNMLQLAEKGEPVNMKTKFSEYSLEVIGACVFGIRFDSLTNPDHPFIVNSNKVNAGGLPTILLFLLIGILPQSWTFLSNYLQKQNGMNFFIEAAKGIIKNRRKEPMQENVDFLQLMLDAKEEKLDNSETDKQETTEADKTNLETKSPWTKTLDEDEIVAQCATFLFAGHDTVAAGVSFVAYNLALNPKVQDQLLQEIDDAWDKNGDIDYDVLHKMHYLNAVVSETLRLHTIGLRTTRQAKEDYHIPNTNIIIPKDTLVRIPIYALHHDPEFFPEPEKFIPDRFLPENKDNIQPYTYMPFSEGPRNCIAMRFALMNIKFSLAYILRYIKFVATEETKKPLEFLLGGNILNAKNGIIVQLQKRRASNQND